MPKKKRAQTQRAAASAARSLSSEGSDSEELEPAPRKRARRGAVDEPCAPYITAAAQSAAATVVGQTNQHIEALQSQQALIEKQILKLKARLQVSDDEAKDALEAKITTLEQKVEEIDDKICALL